MLLTFESLPDEILMIIFQYSGDIIDIFRTYLGLNQRFNQILLDKRLHLLTDFIHTKTSVDYYHSEVFQRISQQLLSVNTAIDEQNLYQILQPLLSFSIQQKYIQYGLEFKSTYENFQSIRQQLNDDKRIRIDHELQIEFENLENQRMIITDTYINRIKSLVLIEGAQLQCDSYELAKFNLCQAINNSFLAYINDKSEKRSSLASLYLKLFKILLISNPLNLKNRDYVGNGGCNVAYFLIYTIYHLQHFYHGRFSSPTVNKNNYHTIINLFLFAMQCQKQTFQELDHMKRMMFDMLSVIQETHKDIFIQTAQYEIMKIIVDENTLSQSQPWDDYENYTIRNALKRLVKNCRLDVLGCICRHSSFQKYLNAPENMRNLANIMTQSRSERLFFCELLNDKSFEFLRSNKSLLFIVLDKKERQLLEHLIKLSPELLHELDDDGNDCLLYICLKVSGCRHRIIEYLIKIGSNTDKRNFKGENFLDVLQLQRNEKLLKHLIEHEIIKTIR